MNDKKDMNTRELFYVLAKRAVIISAIFASIMAILLIANFIQTQSVDPLNSKALNQLLQSLQENPQDEVLKEQIRALDLLARKAYFTHQWQIRTGGLLLFISVLVLLISLKYISSLQAQLPNFDDSKKENPWETRLLARRFIIYAGLGLFVLAFVLGVFSRNELGEPRKKDKVTFATSKELKENWPTFRGPEGIGHAYHTNVPTTWNGATGENITWKVVVPKSGLNSPIIWKKKIYMAGADEESREVYCYDADSGDLLWTKEVNNIPGSPNEVPDVTEDTGYAAPTMATDGERVFAIYANGDLISFDLEGNRLWAKNLGLPDNHYGHSSSLFTFKEKLLVQYDTNEKKQLFAFHTVSGEQIYATPRDDVQISWASPVLVNTGARDEIILNSNPFVISYNPDNGQELWRVKCMDAEVGPSVAYADGWIYAVNEYAVLAGIKLEGTPQTVWEYEDDLSEASSPVATKDFLFLASSYGTVTCFDAKSGEVYWMHEYDEGFYSSPIVVGDKVFVMDRDGVVHIFKAAKEFEAVADNELGEKSDTIPAFMHNRIYIRGEDHLFCIGK
ncbi:PQQ-binding-like beta-propeller repeat protein [candidate division KSB1 bacterium]|nr:PQQ-binding-like beta-propeller repeat protein [candidate division KSB1 bacterium]